jgi:DsbC/DsbD-like thiol-disulfide interchange protein
MFKQLITALFLGLSLSGPTHAGGMDDLAQLEVLDGGLSNRGTYIAALRLTLPEGWKTYWRAPGDAGIPPRFSWRGSRNVGSVNITWPSPEVFQQNGLQTIGYTTQMVLPIEITPTHADRPIRLKGEIEFGMCKEVCIPGALKFNHDIDAGAARNPTIVAALAQRPFSASEADVRTATCRLSPTTDGMQVTAQITMPSAGGREVAVIEPGNPALWSAGSSTKRSGSTLTAVTELVNTGSGSFVLDRSAIRITVLGQNHSVDIQGCDAG